MLTGRRVAAGCAWPLRAASAEWLRSAAAGDSAVLEPGLGPAAGPIEGSRLDCRADAMARLAALVAGGQPGTTYEEQVTAALDHGVTLNEIVGVLAALLPQVGAARVTAAVPPAALEALGVQPATGVS